EAAVPADFVVEVAAAHAVGAQHAGALVEIGGEGGEHAGITEGAEVLGGVEAEGGEVAERTGGGAVPGGSEGLGGIFDEQKGMALLKGGKGVPVGALAVEVDGENGLDRQPGCGGKDLFDGDGREVKCKGIDIGQE